jgi:hypothetical protein
MTEQISLGEELKPVRNQSAARRALLPPPVTGFSLIVA